jgi:hypothetical protein
MTYDLSLLDHIKELCGKQRQRPTRLFFWVRSRVPGVLHFNTPLSDRTAHVIFQLLATWPSVFGIGQSVVVLFGERGTGFLCGSWRQLVLELNDSVARCSSSTA